MQAGTWQRAKRKATEVAALAWATATLKHGTHSRDAVRRIVASLANSIMTRPSLADFAKRLLASSPSLKNKLRTAVLYVHYQDAAARDFVGIGKLDVSAEPEAVRDIYVRLVRTRERLSSGGESRAGL